MNFIYIAYLFVIAHCLDFIPERCEVTYVNPKFLKYATCNVKRYSRRTKYFINVETEFISTFGNNVTVELVFFERLGNEYKRSFVEIKRKLCKFFDDPYTSVPMKQVDMQCPTLPGVYHWSNMSINLVSFPYQWPFKSGRMNYSAYSTETREEICNAALYLVFKEKTKKQRE